VFDRKMLARATLMPSSQTVTTQIIYCDFSYLGNTKS